MARSPKIQSWRGFVAAPEPKDKRKMSIPKRPASVKKEKSDRKKKKNYTPPLLEEGLKDDAWGGGLWGIAAPSLRYLADKEPWTRSRSVLPNVCIRVTHDFGWTRSVWSFNVIRLCNRKPALALTKRDRTSSYAGIPSSRIQ